MKIAIASSGLGHVRRGIESWANDLGLALHRSGADVTLFQGAPSGTEPWRRVMACCRRDERPVARIRAVTRHLSGWRYGCGSEYDVEQTTFAFSLWRQIRKDYDILHVQDPTLALHLDRLHRKGWSRPRVILAHGTEEEDSFLQKFSYLQHLAPCYQEAWQSRKPPGQLSFAVPNFVDTGIFQPGDRTRARSLWNLPENALIILSVAALKKTHKRCDYLIGEFADFQKRYDGLAMLLMAGGRDKETPEVVELGKTLGSSLRMLESVEREKLSSLYQAADIFAIASLHEMMPIAVLEALASKLPVTCNRTPTLEWMAGRGGAPEDISAPGGLVRQWTRLADLKVRAAMSAEARSQAETTFSEPVVLKRVQDMYQSVMASE